MAPASRLLLFDFDGVVVDSYRAFFDAYTAACRAIARPGLADEQTFLGVFDSNMLTGLKRLGIEGPALARFIDTLKRELTPRMPSVRCFDGMLDLLAEAARRHPTRILTSNLTALVTEYLQSQGLAAIPPVLGVDVEPSKVAKIRLARAQEPALTACYIGDTAGDMLEGREAGAIPVGVAWGWHDPSRLRAAGAQIIVTRPEDLLNLAL